MQEKPLRLNESSDALYYGIGIIELKRAKGIRARFHQFLFWLIRITTKKYKFEKPEGMI